MGALDRVRACATTGVGSLPFEDAATAVAWVREAYEVPFCPAAAATRWGHGQRVARGRPRPLRLVGRA